MSLDRRLIAPTLVLALVATGLLLGSCSREEPAPKIDTSPGLQLKLPDGESDQYGPLPEKVGDWKVSRGAAPGYVPDAACNECHGEIYKSYQKMGMARSFYPPDEKNVIEDFSKSYYHKASDRYYSMSWRDGKLYQKRWRADAAGQEFAVYEAEVAWIIGSGNHVRTYLSQTERGEMHQLPMSWYTGVGWRMSPGYDSPHHQGFERMITRACMFCHNAYPEVPVGSDLAHKASVFPKKLPHGIGCQRCHGPGARHVEIALNDDAEGEDIRARIVNPKNFEPGRKDELCMSCHLQPESEFLGDLLPRFFDRPAYSYVAGQKLGEYMVHLDHGTEEEKRQRFEINHHAYRLRWSKCFTESDGKLSCTTCHNPHRKIKKAERASYYRQKCMQCHDLSDCQMEEMGTTVKPSEADCVSCHMITGRPIDVVNTTVTDHFIRRRKPEKDFAAPRDEHIPRPEQVSINPYFPEHRKLPHWKLYLGLAEESAPSQEGRRRWFEALKQTRPHPVTTYLRLGQFFLESADPLAKELHLEAVAKFPEEASAHGGLGVTELQAKRPDKALPHLKKALALAPDSPATNFTIARAYAESGNHHSARAAYEKAIRLRPNGWEIWHSYGLTLMALQDLDAALEACMRAIALNPDDDVSFLNASLIHGDRKDFGKMFQLLERGARNILPVRLHLIREYIVVEKEELRSPLAAYALAKTAVEKHPKNGPAHLYFAMTMLFSRRQNDIGAMLEKARSLGADPTCCDAVAGLALWKDGKKGEAAKILDPVHAEITKEGKERLRPILRWLIDTKPFGR